jgi:sucrose-6-phosphate hydrolase SacC (GH32 family)
MSIPRSLTLRNVPSADGGEVYTLVQRPVTEFDRLRIKTISLDTSAAAWPPTGVTQADELTELPFILETTLKPATARSCGFRLRTGPDEFTEFGYDREPGVVYVDRRQSGNVSFHSAFPGRHDAPARVIDGMVKLQVVVDRSSIEVFINDGEAVISDRIFPTGEMRVIEVFAGDESAKIVETQLSPLKSIWRE